MLRVFQKMFGWGAISLEKERRLQLAWAEVDELTTQLKTKNERHLENLKRQVETATDQGIAILEESLDGINKDHNSP